MNVNETAATLLKVTVEAAKGRYVRELLKNRDDLIRLACLSKIDALADIELEIKKGLTSG
jgi:hypothetical protein